MEAHPDDPATTVTEATPLRALHLTLAFLLELVALVGYALLGWSLADGAVRLVPAAAFPLAFAVVWGALLSPRAPVAVPVGVAAVLRVVLLAGGGAALAAAGHPVLGAVVGAVVLVDAVLARVTEPRPAGR